jgi:hypothetical protein
LAARINITNIADEVSRLIKKYDERDPEKLAQAMKIMVDYMPMGLHEGCCKGFFETIPSFV